MRSLTGCPRTCREKVTGGQPDRQELLKLLQTLGLGDG